MEKKFGGNGEVTINREKGIAIKTLRRAKSQESKTRFIREMEYLQKIKDQNIDNIIEIIDINQSDLSITMKAYDGDLSSFIDITRGNVLESVRLLLPIIKALHQLSSSTPAIFHRDIKPANILVDNISKTLFLADFGCAYIDSGEDIRHTPDFRAVGAQHYRAPEYDYGRVEEVTEQGDIFSIGKVLWYMINGVKDEIFPYTLWFPNEYNLENRFEISSELIKANLIIASCLNINPKDRPTYSQLIQTMESIFSRSTDNHEDESKKLKIMTFEAERKFKEVESKSFIKNMLNTFYIDVYEAIIEIEKKYGDMGLIFHLKNGLTSLIQSKDNSIQYKVDNDPESYIYSTSFPNLYLSLNYHRSHSLSDKNYSDIELPHISCSYNITSNKKGKTIKIISKNRILCTDAEGGMKTYGKNDLIYFFSCLIEDYIS